MLVFTSQGRTGLAHRITAAFAIQRVRPGQHFMLLASKATIIKVLGSGAHHAHGGQSQYGERDEGEGEADQCDLFQVDAGGGRNQLAQHPEGAAQQQHGQYHYGRVEEAVDERARGQIVGHLYTDLGRWCCGLHLLTVVWIDQSSGCHHGTCALDQIHITIGKNFVRKFESIG